MNRFNGPVSFMSSGPAACRVLQACARKKCTERACLLLASHESGKETDEIVIVEFMGDGWRGSEKVLNREEQINAMLSRPFYQPFNIICSCVHSLACAAQITFDRDRTRWVRVLHRSWGLIPLFAADERERYYIYVQRCGFLFRQQPLPLSAFQRRNLNYARNYARTKIPRSM